MPKANDTTVESSSASQDACKGCLSLQLKVLESVFNENKTDFQRISDAADGGCDGCLILRTAIMKFAPETPTPTTVVNLHIDDAGGFNSGLCVDFGEDFIKTTIIFYTLPGILLSACSYDNELTALDS
jgi:hypothetical protein